MLEYLKGQRYEDQSSYIRMCSHVFVALVTFEFYYLLLKENDL